MQGLVGLLDGLGCKNIQTYIQSGNSVFQSKHKQSSKLTHAICEKILESYGFEPKVLLLEESEIQAAVDNNPYATKDGKALHFFFLDSQPKNPDLERLTAARSKSEKFELGNKLFYLYAPDGIGRSKLAAMVEKSLGVPATARNWNTVRKLLGLIRQA